MKRKELDGESGDEMKEVFVRDKGYYNSASQKMGSRREKKNSVGGKLLEHEMRELVISRDVRCEV